MKQIYVFLTIIAMDCFFLGMKRMKGKIQVFFLMFMQMPRTEINKFGRYLEARNNEIARRQRLDIMNRNPAFRRLPPETRNGIVRESLY